MFKLVKKISIVLIGAILNISLIQNGSPKIPSKVEPLENVSNKSGEIRVGGEKEGIILLVIDLGNSSASKEY